MNKGLIFTFSFAIGAVVGSVATWKLLKTRYEQRARDEIEEVRAYYASTNSEITKDDSAESSNEEQNDSTV